MKLSDSFSGELRSLSYWIANGGYPLLEGVDYSSIFEEPSALERVYAIFANVIEMDENAIVINSAQAAIRAAQYIKSYIDPNYIVDPPFEDWETMLY
jgi:hypothetical protein